MADYGIRASTKHMFIELLPMRATKGNTAFRKAVMFWIMEEFGVSDGSAAGAYNFAFKQVKSANPELVEGLGRPDGKNNGGRKAKVKVIGAAPMLLLGYSPKLLCYTPKEVPEQQLFDVVGKKSGEVVAEKLCYEDARDMINAAAAKKKAKLYFV